MGNPEEPPRVKVLDHFRWIQDYNAQVEAFLDLHTHGGGKC